MKLAFVILLTVSVCILAADKKRKNAKPPDVTVLQSAARRSESKIAIDGRVKNTGEKPILELTLLFDFLAPGRAVITTQKASIDEETLPPGAEAAFHVELNDQVRAVEYQLGAVDRNQRDLRVANPGPFVIE